MRVLCLLYSGETVSCVSLITARNLIRLQRSAETPGATPGAGAGCVPCGGPDHRCVVILGD